MRVLRVLQVLLSHWRRHPGQLAALVLGLALATGLWTGVQAINSEAYRSYDRAAALLSPGGRPYLAPRQGAYIPLSTYVRLQRAGWRTSPLLEGRLRLGRDTYRVIGIEPLSLPPSSEASGALAAFSLDYLREPSGVALAHPATAAALKQQTDLPRIIAHADVPPDMLLTDIGVAARLLKQPDQLSRLILLADQPPGRPPLGEIAPDLDQLQPSQQLDVRRLTGSFHLNLTAFGFLSFAVGLFIVYGVIGLTFEQRRASLRQLMMLGASRRDLYVALLTELLAFALFAGGLGVLLGYLLAGLLLPDVAATLRSLYEAPVAGELGFHKEWWLAGLLMALVGAGLAAGSGLLRLSRLSILEAGQLRVSARRAQHLAKLQLAAALLLLLLAGLLVLWGSGLILGFAVLGALLLGAALALPAFLSFLLRFAQSRISAPLGQWFIADARQQLPGLSLALMALLLAIAANIGVGAMVGSFRMTFIGWLDQRLAAELYVTTRSDEEAAHLKTFLAGKVDAMLPIMSVDAPLDGQPGTIYGMADHATYRNHWPLLTASPDVWERLQAGGAGLINEQLSRRARLAIGDRLTIAPGRSIEVVGIYSDYGNPQPQAVLGLAPFRLQYPDEPSLRFVLRVPKQEVDAVTASLTGPFGLPEQNIVDQRAIKAHSIEIFERTFAVTDALNVLTLLVAGIAIFTSLLTLAGMRLPQLAPVWAMGVSRAQLARLELLRALLLAALTAVLALPAGLALSWGLLEIVNVEAFGWRLPLHLFPGDWLRLLLFALAAAGLAAALPARKLARISPDQLLKVFSNER